MQASIFFLEDTKRFPLSAPRRFGNSQRWSNCIIDTLIDVITATNAYLSIFYHLDQVTTFSSPTFHKQLREICNATVSDSFIFISLILQSILDFTIVLNLFLYDPSQKPVRKSNLKLRGNCFQHLDTLTRIPRILIKEIRLSFGESISSRLILKVKLLKVKQR